MTKQKKKEVNKYIKYIEEVTCIKFKCRNIKDYIFIKTLYLLLLSYDDIDDEFYKPVFNYYNNYKMVKDANYFGYSLEDTLKQYIVKYYYGDITNFAVLWSYYEDLEIDEFEERLARGYRVLDHKMNKNIEKMIRLLDNIAMRAQDVYTFKKFEKNKEKDQVIIWHTQRDNAVCEYCASYNGNKFYKPEYVPDRHPNCRCWLEIVDI